MLFSFIFYFWFQAMEKDLAERRESAAKKLKEEEEQYRIQLEERKSQGKEGFDFFLLSSVYLFVICYLFLLFISFFWLCICS
jgi:hypothetical protein